MCEYTTFDVNGGNQILARHEGLVHWVVRRQWLGTLSFQDALHEGRIGLWSALQHYDPRRGTAFSTYAVPAIARAVWRAIAIENRLSTSAPCDAPWAVDSDEIDAIDDALVRTALRDLTMQLPTRLRDIVIAHHGLDGNSPQTFAAIGRALGVSRQRVHQLHARAILWLADPAHSLQLRRLLGYNSRADYRRTLARMRNCARRKHRRARTCAGRGEAQQ
jgi:RNA polymerase sigma factor (sigma-70 family)